MSYKAKFITILALLTFYEWLLLFVLASNVKPIFEPYGPAMIGAYFSIMNYLFICYYRGEKNTKFNIVKNFILICTFFILIALLPAHSAHAREIHRGWTQQGVSSYYHGSLNGFKTASGERYMHSTRLTAAHKYLPFGTVLEVTDKDTDKKVIVTVNDRGPFVKNRILDLSGLAAKRLGMDKKGVCNARIKVLSVPKKSKRKLFDHGRF